MFKFKIRKFFISLSLPILLSGCFSHQRNLSEHQWDLVHEAESYFNEKPSEKGNFVQTGNFRRGSGNFILEPGHLCLYYHSPKSGSLFIDSKHLIEVDDNSGARTSFKIEDTPFVRFLQPPIHFTSQSTRIEDVVETSQGYEITLSKTYRMKKCVVTLFFSRNEGQANFSGLKASIAGYYLQALFQNIQKQKIGSNPLCFPPS
ncbi:hypothetical protein FAI41_00465 [Acetobacteraceae bacterium]|nr:hypothetical protein FAI41_00465 [Acetobacteraceae bacterium]